MGIVLLAIASLSMCVGNDDDGKKESGKETVGPTITAFLYEQGSFAGHGAYEGANMTRVTLHVAFVNVDRYFICAAAYVMVSDGETMLAMEHQTETILSLDTITDVAEIYLDTGDHALDELSKITIELTYEPHEEGQADDWVKQSDYNEYTDL